MKFSIWPNPERPTAEVLDLARMADSEGWHCLWYADHYMPNSGGEDVLPGDVHECWAMLPAIAAVTDRLRIGSLVAPTSVHHPAVLANRAATIDHISDGRLVLGIGAGLDQQLQIPLGHRRGDERLARTEIIRPRITGAGVGGDQINPGRHRRVE